MSRFEKMIFVSPKAWFAEVVEDAMNRRKLRTHPLAQQYIVGLLEHYVSASNLYEEKEDGSERRISMLAEMLLRASQEESNSVRIELYKKLGDTSLYISGFFGDSLNRKIVDIDYYAEMGGTAYGQLSSSIREDEFRQVYGELSKRFLEFVDILTYISQKTMVQGQENVLRLYDRYLVTGSPLAKEQLIEKGIVPPARVPGRKDEPQ